jgi:signal transduction histidine kinase
LPHSSPCLLSFLAQQSVPAEALRRLAERGGDSALRASVARSPVAAREATQRLLERTAKGDAAGDQALASANRLAGLIAMEHRDSFPLREVMRFARWSPAERGAKVAVDSLRRAGNAALGRDGFDAALTDWRESERQARVLGDTAGMAAAAGNIGAGFYGESMLDSATAYFDRAAGLARRARDTRTELNAMGGLANVLRDRGDFRAAREPVRAHAGPARAHRRRPRHRRRSQQSRNPGQRDGRCDRGASRVSRVARREPAPRIARGRGDGARQPGRAGQRRGPTTPAPWGTTPAPWRSIASSATGRAKRSRCTTSACSN